MGDFFWLPICKYGPGQESLGIDGCVTHLYVRNLKQQVRKSVKSGRPKVNRQLMLSDLLTFGLADLYSSAQECDATMLNLFPKAWVKKSGS